MDLVQVLFNSIITAAELGVIAIGLTLTFSLLKFANFAHVEIAVLGAYVAYTFNQIVGWNFAVSLCLAALVAGAAGVAMDWCVFRRFRGTGDVAPMIASLGLSIAMRHTVQAVWGPQFVQYDFEIQPGLQIFGAYITQQQIGIVAIVVVAMLGFHLTLQYTTVGKAMRATSTNAELAQASGIDTGRIIRFVWFVGAAFAGLGGTLLAWDTQLDPYLGFNLVIPIFCVVLIGGVGSVYGAIVGALLVGLATNFAVAVDIAPLVGLLGAGDLVDAMRMPVAYKPAVAYAAVILLLLFRPGGLMRKELA